MYMCDENVSEEEDDVIAEIVASLSGHFGGLTVWDIADLLGIGDEAIKMLIQVRSFVLFLNVYNFYTF